MRIEILLYDGFDEIDALGPFEVLSANFDVELVSLDRPGTVTTARGLQLVTGAALGRPDGVIVPGGGWQDRATEGAWAQSQRRRLPDTVAELAPDLSWVASVCTGALLLAAAGLLTDRYATTNRRTRRAAASRPRGRRRTGRRRRGPDHRCGAHRRPRLGPLDHRTTPRHGSR